MKQTPRQKQASKRNFLKFQLKGMVTLLKTAEISSVIYTREKLDIGMARALLESLISPRAWKKKAPE